MYQALPDKKTTLVLPFLHFFTFYFLLFFVTFKLQYFFSGTLFLNFFHVHTYRPSIMSTQNSYTAINHPGHRRMVSCFLINRIIPLMVSAVSSVCALKEHEWSIAHLLSVPINTMSFTIPALTCYQLVFFIYCVKIQYESLVNAYNKHFRDIKSFNMDEIFFKNCIQWWIKLVRLIKGSFSKIVSSFKDETFFESVKLSNCSS